MYIDVVTTGSIRDRLYLADLQEIRIPEASETEQAVISQMADRAEDEMIGLLREIAERNEQITDRIHCLIDVAEAYSASHGDDDLQKRFAALAGQWRRETGASSSISRKVEHPAYQKIIAMGDAAVPLILRELRDRPAHWFTALRAIVESPPPNEGSDIARATAAWLGWGKEHGYIE